MKISSIFTIAFLGIASLCYGQQNPAWDKLEWLIGEWQGEGSGIPGEGGGIFTFSYDLEKRIMVRKSHSEYPGENIKSRTIHDDLMIIYPDSKGNPDKAIYFDYEGHTINYAITYPDSSIVLTSVLNPETPTFRLIYTMLDVDTVYTKFEMSRDGKSFMTYIEGKSKKLLNGK
jgi:hypothetical protein